MSTQPLTRLPPSILRRPFLNCYSRRYSFESGRKPKSGPTLDPDPDQLSPTNNNEPGDSKPIVISGRGRRLNHRSQPIPCPPTPKLALPFKPLSANHLAHLRPTTLFLDVFFSHQRPLLEIELSPSQRRPITAEIKQSKLGLESDNTELESSLEHEDQDEDVYLGSPSDPAFKQPQPSTTRPPVDENEFDDQAWSTSDPYSSFLITEPDGVHPAWSDALKRCLATSQAFLLPPLPKIHTKELQLSSSGRTTHLADASKPEQQCQASFKSEQETQLDLDRKQALSFLAPYGLKSHTKATPDKNDYHSKHQVRGGSAPFTSKQDSFLQPGISQDPLSLTIQAARFLHFVTTANRWPIAANWAAIESKLTAAEQAYKNNASKAATTPGDNALGKKDSSLFPPIRGSERSIYSGRRNRSNHSLNPWNNVLADNDKSVGRGRHSISLTIDQLKEIIKYSHQILSHKIQLDSIPTATLKSFERFGQFLIQKNLIKLYPNIASNLVNQKTILNNTNKPASLPPPIIPIIMIEPSSPSSPSTLHNDQSGDDKSDTIVHLDSVFRKKKRKMKVHKYKKRRKARNTLKKRQGKS